jgi:hypothetical protein
MIKLPSPSLSITDPLLPLGRLRPSVAGATMPAAAPAWAVTGNLGVVETQLSTGSFSQTIPAFTVTAD